MFSVRETVSGAMIYSLKLDFLNEANMSKCACATNVIFLNACILMAKPELKCSLCELNMTNARLATLSYPTIPNKPRMRSQL